MRKLFLLIPALLLTLAINATKIDINTSTTDALRVALYNSTAGDTIVMAAGTYVESKSNYIAWKRDNVVMAAEGAEVIIKPHVSFRVTAGSRAVLIGVKIDASEILSEGSYEDIFQAGDGTDGNRLILEKCEIYGNVSKTMLRCASDKKLDSLIINNCYIHDNAQATLRLQSTSLKGVTITNTTVANVANGGSFWCAPMDISSTAGDAKVIVDHCTFYHNTSISSSYADVTVGYDGSATSDVTITNCIFAQPASYDGSRAINLVNGGTVRNCLTFNYTKSTNGIQGATVKENCIAVDPLFTNAASGDYSFPNNWVTMSISPAVAAATDGSDLGDPRWYSAPTLPSTDFASPYQFVGAKALISGNISYDGTNEYLYYTDNSVCGTAKWKIHAERACVLEATLNMNAGTTTGHIFRVEILDADGNSIGDVAEPAQSSAAGNILVPGTLSIPAAGNYTVILHNDQAWSSSIIDGFTLAYVGGATITVPAEELVATEAVLVDNGNLKVSKVGGNLQYDDNEFPLQEYVYWNINATKAGNMDVTLNLVAPASGHQFLVELYSDLSGSPIASTAEAVASYDAGAITLPALNIPTTGNYIVKLTNQTQWSSAILHSIQFTYTGGATITVPAEELVGTEAVIVDNGNLKVYKDGDNLQYDDNEFPLQEYVYWNINATKAGNMNVTLNLVAPASGHQFLVELYTDLSLSPVASTAEAAPSYDAGAIELPVLNIPNTGNYIVKLTNQTQWSSAILYSVQFAYTGGAVVDVPDNVLLAEDAVLESIEMYRESNGDIHYGDNGTNPADEYAWWNVHATQAGNMTVALNFVLDNASGHLYRVELYDGSTLQSYTEEAATSWDENITLDDPLNIPAVGDYTILSD